MAKRPQTREELIDAELERAVAPRVGVLPDDAIAGMRLLRTQID